MRVNAIGISYNAKGGHMNIRFEIITNELVNGIWVPVVSHKFYGRTQEELNAMVEAHKRADAIFRATCTGNFNGIVLKNSIPLIS